jgi:hypothetical protein
MASKARNPYVGIDSFTEKDSDYFFGRDEESRQLTSLLIAHQIVLFYAQSGAGKTSLLQAQVIPNLRRQEDMEVLPIARVGGDLPPGLAPSNVYVFNLLYSMTRTGTDPQTLEDLSLREGLRPYLEQQDNEQHPQPSLLVLDQFEELFTTYPERYAERAGFFQQVRQCLAIYPQLGLLLSMREDFIARLDYYASLMPDRLRVRYRMERLDEHQARAAVEGPAARAGRPFQAGVAQSLVDDLRRIQVAATPEGPKPSKPPLGPYVEPLHLQIVCHRLWEKLLPGEEIGPGDVEDFGDVDQALIDLYEDSLVRALRAVEEDDCDKCDERQLRDWFEKELITSVGTRGLVFRGERETKGVPNRAVEVLSEAYVLRRIPRGDDTWYELAHDRLVEPIQRANRAWREARAQLAPWLRQAEIWDQQGRPDGLLLSERMLAEAETWATERPDDLGKVEHDFLTEGRRYQETLARERQQNRLIRWGLLGTALFACFAIGLAILAGFQMQAAKSAAATADMALVQKEQAERERATYVVLVAERLATKAPTTEATRTPAHPTETSAPTHTPSADLTPGSDQTDIPASPSPTLLPTATPTPSPMARSVRIGIVGRNEPVFYEIDYKLLRTAKIETIVMLSATEPKVFERIKSENPDIEIIVRLYDDRMSASGHPTPKEFAERMIPLMGALKPYASQFEVHNEPNHQARIEGWGSTDEDAESFNEWFLQVYNLLKLAHPWASLGFPGLAIPNSLHRDRAWLEICTPAIRRADWLGAHAAWATAPDGSSLMLDPDFGLSFLYYHEQFPEKIIQLTDFANTNVFAGYPFTEEMMAEEYVAYYEQLYNYPFLNSASSFIMSSPDPQWSALAWRLEDGTMRKVVFEVGNLARPPLRPPHVPR